MKYQQIWFKSRAGKIFLRNSDYVVWVPLESPRKISVNILVGVWEYDIERIHGNLDADL